MIQATMGPWMWPWERMLTKALTSSSLYPAMEASLDVSWAEARRSVC